MKMFIYIYLLQNAIPYTVSHTYIHQPIYTDHTYTIPFHTLRGTQSKELNRIIRLLWTIKELKFWKTK